jgi:large subunit ribosomal protein L5
MNNLYIYYKEIVSNLLLKKFEYKNIHQIPKIVKININMGLGLNAQNKTYLKKAIDELSTISCQFPMLIKSKKSISNFKIRKNMPIGLLVTLRRKKMFTFLEKLIKLVFPRIRDFQGLNIKHFDKQGNYNFGISNQMLFPEFDDVLIEGTRGFNITIVTSSLNFEENYYLLKFLGMPFKNI